MTFLDGGRAGDGRHPPGRSDRTGLLCGSGAIGIAATLAIAIHSAGPAAAAGPEVSHFTLSNGLEVVVIPDHRTPVVTHMIWYKVGSADETAGKSGLRAFS